MHPTRTKLFHFIILPALLFTILQGCNYGTRTGDGYGDLQNTEIYETWNEDFSWKDLVHQPGLMHPLDKYQLKKADDYFWLKAPVLYKGDSSVRTTLGFSQLTEVQYFLCSGDSLIATGKAGKFRPISEINPGDTRFRCFMQIPAGKPLTLWIKVHHTKKYQPQFDFYLQPEPALLKQDTARQRADLWMQGALILLFLYSALSFAVTRFRPYCWLMVFIAGVGMYGISMSGYFIDWFFPEHPETGWLFNIHFGHLGLFGLLMLVLNFWQLKSKSHEMYTWGVIILRGLVVVTVISFCIDYYWSDYRFMNKVNLIGFLAPFMFITISAMSVWRQLNRAQKFLGFGIMLFAAAGLMVTISSALLGEHSIIMASYVAGFAIILVSLLFAIGLKEELRLLEVQKQQALEKLSKVQRTNNLVLERRVKERTGQLERSNEVLTEKNGKITVLINELNHRVKNNLQMLYSLNSMQLPKIEDEASRVFMEGNIARIKAMMVVNKQLFNTDHHRGTNAKDLTEEFCRHIAGIYKNGKAVSIQVDAPSNMCLNPKYTLSFGLILTELLTNSFKHAFGDQPLPCIKISFDFDEDRKEIIFSYIDNGCGMDQYADHSRSMGLSLIHDLALQLESDVQILSKEGLQYIFRFPAGQEILLNQNETIS